MRQTLADIEARHADIKKLEQSIFELHEMFVDMANLVEGQGELIDRIEFHVGKAVEYVKAGTEDTRKAMKLQREAQKVRHCPIDLTWVPIDFTLLMLSLCNFLHSSISSQLAMFLNVLNGPNWRRWPQQKKIMIIVCLAITVVIFIPMMGSFLPIPGLWCPKNLDTRQPNTIQQQLARNLNLQLKQFKEFTRRHSRRHGPRLPPPHAMVAVASVAMVIAIRTSNINNLRNCGHPNQIKRQLSVDFRTEL